MWILTLFLMSHTVDLGYNIKYHTADLTEKDRVEIKVKEIESEVNYYLLHPLAKVPEECKDIVSKLRGKIDIRHYPHIKGLNPVRLKITGIKKIKDGEYRVDIKPEILSKNPQVDAKEVIILNLKTNGASHNENIKTR